MSISILKDVSVGKYVKHINYVNSIATVTIATVTIVTQLHVSPCLFTYIAIVSETSTKMLRIFKIYFARNVAYHI